LAVADDRVVDESAQLGSRNFTGEGAAVAPVKILCSQLELPPVDLQRNRLQCQERRREHDFDVAMHVDLLRQLMNKQARLMNSEVHLPVRDDEFLSWHIAYAFS